MMRSELETLSIVGACALNPQRSRRQSKRWLVVRNVRGRSKDYEYQDSIDLRVFVSSPTFTGLTVRGVTIPVSNWPQVNEWVASDGDDSDYPGFTLELDIDPTTTLVCGYYDDAKYGKYLDLRYFVRKESYKGWDKRGVRVRPKVWPRVKRLLAATAPDLDDWQLHEFAEEEIQHLLSKHLPSPDKQTASLPFEEEADPGRFKDPKHLINDDEDSQDTDPSAPAGVQLEDALDWMDPRDDDSGQETTPDLSPDVKRGEAFFEKLDGVDIRDWDARKHLLWVGDLCQLQGPVTNDTVDRLGVFRVTLESGRNQTVYVALRHDDNGEGFFWVFSICGPLLEGPDASHLLQLNTEPQPGAHGIVLVDGTEHVVYFNSVRTVDNWESAMARTIWDVARRGDSLEKDGWGTDQY